MLHKAACAVYSNTLKHAHVAHAHAQNSLYLIDKTGDKGVNAPAGSKNLDINRQATTAKPGESSIFSHFLSRLACASLPKTGATPKMWTSSPILACVTCSGMTFSKQVETSAGWLITPNLGLGPIPATGDMEARGQNPLHRNRKQAELNTNTIDYMSSRRGLGPDVAKDNLNFGMSHTTCRAPNTAPRTAYSAQCLTSSKTAKNQKNNVRPLFSATEKRGLTKNLCKLSPLRGRKNSYSAGAASLFSVCPFSTTGLRLCMYICWGPSVH